MKIPPCLFYLHLTLYNNTPSNAIVNVASNVQANVFTVLFKNKLKTFTNVVIGILGKLILMIFFSSPGQMPCELLPSLGVHRPSVRRTS